MVPISDFIRLAGMFMSLNSHLHGTGKFCTGSMVLF